MMTQVAVSGAINTSIRPLTTKPRTVLLVDDYQIIRQGLSTMLSKDSSITVVGEAKNGAEAIEQALRLRPDVILMDLQMPDMGGVETTIRLKKLLPSVQVVILTDSNTQISLVEILQAGAIGFVHKNTSEELLCETIKRAASGQILIKNDGMEQGLKGLVNSRDCSKSGQGLPPRVSLLSGREIEVLQLVTEGCTNLQIGISLSISGETVKKHVQNIITKLSASDRTHAAVKAVRSGLIN
jgi:two-component system response regulator DegU